MVKQNDSHQQAQEYCFVSGGTKLSVIFRISFAGVLSTDMQKLAAKCNES